MNNLIGDHHKWVDITCGTREQSIILVVSLPKKLNWEEKEDRPTFMFSLQNKSHVFLKNCQHERQEGTEKMRREQMS